MLLSARVWSNLSYYRQATQHSEHSFKKSNNDDDLVVLAAGGGDGVCMDGVGIGLLVRSIITIHPSPLGDNERTNEVADEGETITG